MAIKIGNRFKVAYEEEMRNMNDPIFHEKLPGDLLFRFWTPIT